ncbi:MAG: PTS sugar transporter subunit IIA [Acidithiobacillus ferriphilus]|jgi:PTS system ascorbate-specific IIA component|uniref:PTS sugar transporter subunit IIA n=1 Tax=Acidithiobacillus ferrivorans TaxID=160808 RepID=A0A257SJD4_9PROT|nr:MULTISPECIES: PTS sugar transporter subunit IIA [Acidithiobacillus]OYV73292.1 MAG: PTS sugar transporter subunit IIA [Acidithiobacillus ferrivorans]MBU2785001.1 PTS sugar transporter subunit IIA [Acidithiobacillus ferriphilus]MBU2847122.1 PTS sugar transporter subunit IIA [Acidithiobacillus ferriphilus]MDA8247299.1 PTS sugar transporter subunit IIA [Acidithiobacillus sp.]MEB8475113.1 PTS sugar transporter subunit IIA [Acidithiobacillus ferriphilus]
MITIVLLTHAGLGEAFAAALQHIFGTMPPALEILEILPDQPPEEGRRRLWGLLEKINDGDAMLILNDLYGATPANLIPATLPEGRVAAVSGLNLAMLLRALSRRSDGLAAARQGALEGGVQGVADILEQRPHAVLLRMPE